MNKSNKLYFVKLGVTEKDLEVTNNEILKVIAKDVYEALDKTGDYLLKLEKKCKKGESVFVAEVELAEEDIDYL